MIIANHVYRDRFFLANQQKVSIQYCVIPVGTSVVAHEIGEPQCRLAAITNTTSQSQTKMFNKCY